MKDLLTKRELDLLISLKEELDDMCIQLQKLVAEKKGMTLVQGGKNESN
ncbi:MAG: hypothetical protein ACW96U_00865 [Candidatus Heimdallarchaeaceae archaeon]|jgi:hypothetical protein